MSAAIILGFAACAFSLGLALMVVSRRPRSAVQWAFVIGMAGLGLENLFFALATEAALPEDVLFWEKWKLITASCAAPVWLFFSVAYGRINHRDFLRSWRAALVAALVLPVAISALFGGNLIVSGEQISGGQWIVHLGFPGAILNFFLLLVAILVLMNLETTLRAAVGTMLWRIKFMVLGAGLIFVVSAYASSQTLLFHNSSDLSLQSVAALGALVGGALILRCLLRPGHFDAGVYPAKSVLGTSLILALAGLYFFIVGIFAKIVQFFGGDTAFTLKAFILLVVLVAMTVLALSARVRQQMRRFMSRHFQRPMYDYRSM
ncbi:MAG: histidine kinase N-terminal 7TM domain-containing protein, partial [Limisphaerales bacterium]